MKQIFFLILFFSFLGYSQVNNKNQSGKSNNQILNKNINEPKVGSNKLNSDINELENDIIVLKTKQECNVFILNIIITFLTIFFSIGFGMSIKSSWNNESRAKEIFEMYKFDKKNGDIRNDEMFQMFLTDKEKNEKSAIETTEKTINLVNRTLELAVQASERSAKSLKIRLENILKQIDAESYQLIVKKAEAFVDDKNLTSKKTHQTEILKIGNKIEGLENNLIILDQDGLEESQKIKLTPYVTFIKGTDHYLKEHYNDAEIIWLELLKDLNNDQKSKKLKSLINYWLGYLKNNLNKFGDAVKYFKAAEKLCSNDDSRRFELERMIIETQFFNGVDETIIIDELNVLCEKIEKVNNKDANNRLPKVWNTLGNVYYVKARKSEFKDKESLKSSKINFLKVLDIEENISLDDIDSRIKKISDIEGRVKIWSIYGLAETMYYIDKNENRDVAIKLFKNYVFSLAEKEYDGREEKRTKVLAKTCQLLCQLRIDINDKEKLKNLRAMIEIPLSDLDDSLTVYSQLDRKNIKFSEFKNLLIELTKD
jgi:hypothetical protein